MLKINAMKVELFCEILGETSEKIVFEKDNELFVGALFNKVEEWEIITNVLENKEIQANNNKELIEKCYEFYKEHATTCYESTKGTMLHWSYMNGFVNEYLVEFK